MTVYVGRIPGIDKEEYEGYAELSSGTLIIYGTEKTYFFAPGQWLYVESTSDENLFHRL